MWTTLLIGMALIALPQSPATSESIRGAEGIVCNTPEAVVEWNNATAFLTDAEYQAAVENAPADSPCRFASISGLVSDAPVQTFVRKDNRVIDVLSYRPGIMVTMRLYVFMARPMAHDAGL